MGMDLLIIAGDAVACFPHCAQAVLTDAQVLAGRARDPYRQRPKDRQQGGCELRAGDPRLAAGSGIRDLDRAHPILAHLEITVRGTRQRLTAWYLFAVPKMVKHRAMPPGGVVSSAGLRHLPVSQSNRAEPESCST